MQLRWLILFVLSLAFTVNAQELVIREPFQAVLNDLTATQEKYRRLDYNGNPCALIMIGLVDKSASFNGDVVYSEYKQGEWWVYMVEGSQYLKIKTNNNIPKEISFPPLKKLTTYRISFISNAHNQLVASVSDPLLPFYEKVNDEWLLGYLDNKGNIAIPATLNGEGTLFENGTARVEYKGSWYFINSSGQKVANPSWSYSGLHLVRQNWLYGYADKDGSIVIPIAYRDAYEFNNNRAKVMYPNGENAFITPKGKVIFKGTFHEDYFSHNFAPVEVAGGKWGFIDTNGVIQPKMGFYKYACGFSDGLALVINNKNEKGFIDTRGKVVISYSKQRRYDSFSEGLASFSTFFFKGGYINTKGETVFSTPHSASYDGFFSEGLARVSKNFDYGYIDYRGNLVIPIQFDSAGKFKKGFAKVKLFNPIQWAWIDKKGRVLKDRFGRPYHSEPRDN